MIVALITLGIGFLALMYFQGHEREGWAVERKELVRRLQEPRQVMVEERPKHPRPEFVPQNDDAAFKRLRERRAG